MKYKYEIVFGTEFDKDKKVIDIYNIDTILADVSDTFGGFTLFDSQGGYTMKDGTLILELSSTLVILTNKNTDAIIAEYARRIKETLSQESVLLTKTNLESGLFI